MADNPDRGQLDALAARIDAARKAQEPPPPAGSKYTSLSLAWRMVLELVVGMALGVFLGFGLDKLFGTLPLFLLIFALLGFAAGIRTMMRTASEVTHRRGEGRRLGPSGTDETNGTR